MSNAYNLPDEYLADVTYSDMNLGKRSVHDIAKIHNIPENLSGSDKLPIVKKFNKRKSSPPLLQINPERPDLSDTEISLIVSSYNTVGAEVIAHTLGISELTVKRTYEKFKYTPLQQIPMIAIYDTSRYLEPHNERVIYDYDDLNHIDDPRTSKELLRTNLPTRTTEDSIDADLLRDYLAQELRTGNTHKTFFGASGHIMPIKRDTDDCVTIYDRTWCEDIKGIFRKNTLNSWYINKNKDTWSTYSLPFYLNYWRRTYVNDYRFIKMYHDNYFIKYNLYQHTHLLDVYLTSLNKHNTDVLEDSQFSFMMLYCTNVILNSNPNEINKLLTTMYKDYITTTSPITNMPVVYTNKAKYFIQYKPYTDKYYTDTTFIQYNIIRPPIYLRALASPIQDKNKNLRYRFPSNTYKKFEQPSVIIDHHKAGKQYSRKLHADHLYGAVICNNCKTFLSKHTVQECECKDIKIRVTHTLSKPKKHRGKVKLKPITLHLDKLNKDTKDEVLKLLNKSNIEIKNNKAKTLRLYAFGNYRHTHGSNKKFYGTQTITSSIKFTHTYTSLVKDYVEVFKKDTATFTFHLYNYSYRLKEQQPQTQGIFNKSTNILPLYSTFKFPINNTLQEPQII